ncbi:MAG: N-acetyltransferase [Coriobacteriia bacterium]|nr:N-acetyltransferase [Coriobacteriia bacterium]
MNYIVIQNEDLKDYREVENLVREAFWNVYKPGCSKHYVLHTLRNHPDFIKELDFVIKHNDKIIGQIVFVKNHVNDTMGPLCIHPDYQGKDYGRQLLEHGLNKAKEKGYCAILIEGDYNFYNKSGFDYASKFNIKYAGLPENADDSFFLCNELKPGSLKPGIYSTHPAYLVYDKDAEEFDKNFSKKEKLKLPSQIF